MPSINHKMLGFSGENLAAQYLKSKGYEIVENNFTIRGGEIDLVAKISETLVFVEVKTRTQDEFGSGEESINQSKKNRLHTAIERYLDKINYGKEGYLDYRMDLLEIKLEPKTHALKNINHFEDIEL